MKDGIILCNANGVYIATVPAIERVYTTAYVLLAPFTPGISRFRLQGVKGMTAFIDYAALVVRIRKADLVVKHIELPAFSPAVLMKQDMLCSQIEDDAVLPIEFDQTDEAVKWRQMYPKKSPTDVLAEELVKVCYYFERKH